MKLSEILPSVFADGDDPDIQVTTKKYSQFPQANGPGIQGVGLKDGANVRFDLTTDAIAVNPDITFRDGGEPLYDPDEIANITNQLEVNRFLASELSKLEFAGVEVSSDPPAIITDGQLWYDDDRLELFVSYQDGWFSTSPLESRVEAGEALQAEILGRVEAGEKNQASIVEAIDDGIREQTRLRSRIGDLEANSATQENLSEYLPLQGGTNNKMQGNLYLGSHFIAGLAEPTSNDHAATKKYADLKLPKAGGTMTGTFTMQRQDDVSYWNYIDSKTPKAWVGGDSDEAKATQKTHGLILKVGDTNSYKQQFKIQGRSNKDLFKVYDDGTGNFSFYGNVGVTGYLKQDGKDVLVDGENSISTSFRLKSGTQTLLSAGTAGKIKIYNLQDPTDSHHAANKKYVDDKVSGQGVSAYRHTHYFKVEERDSITNGQVHWKAMGSGWLRFMVGTKTNGDFRYTIPDFDTVKCSMPFSISYIEEGDLSETKFVFSGMTDSVRCYTDGQTQVYLAEIDPTQIFCWQPTSVEDMKQVIVKLGSLTP